MLGFNFEKPVSSASARRFQNRWHFAAWNYVNSIIDYGSCQFDLSESGAACDRSRRVNLMECC